MKGKILVLLKLIILLISVATLTCHIGKKQKAKKRKLNKKKVMITDYIINRTNRITFTDGRHRKLVARLCTSM
jgi:hypothetical protein